MSLRRSGFALLTGLWLAIGGSLAFTSTASASTITFDFSGTVLDDSFGQLFPGKAVGDTYTGSFTVDTSAAMTYHSNPFAAFDPTNFAVSIEGTSYTVTHFYLWYGPVSIYHPPADGFEIGFDIPYPGSSGGYLMLRSSNDAYLTGPTIPSNFNLADFDMLAQVQAISPYNQYNSYSYDRGSITAMTPVPEPGTLVLLGAGLGAVAARRRLKKRA